MKKLLSFISSLSLSLSAATSVVACDITGSNNGSNDENSKQEMTLDNIKKWAEDNKIIDYTGPGVFLTNKEDAGELQKQHGQSNFWQYGSDSIHFALVQFVQKVIGDKLNEKFNQNLFNRFNFWYDSTGFSDIYIKEKGSDKKEYLRSQIIKKGTTYEIEVSFALIDRLNFEQEIFDKFPESEDYIRKYPRFLNIDSNHIEGTPTTNIFKFKINYTQTNDFTWNLENEKNDEMLSNLVKTKLNLTNKQKINQNIWKKKTTFSELEALEQYSKVWNKLSQNLDLEENIIKLLELTSDKNYIYGFNFDDFNSMRLKNIKFNKIVEVNNPYKYYTSISIGGVVDEENKYDYTAKGKVFRINLDIENVNLVDLNGTTKTINLKDCVIEIFREDTNTI